MCRISLRYEGWGRRKRSERGIPQTATGCFLSSSNYSSIPVSPNLNWGKPEDSNLTCAVYVCWVLGKHPSRSLSWHSAVPHNILYPEKGLPGLLMTWGAWKGCWLHCSSCVEMYRGFDVVGWAHYTAGLRGRILEKDWQRKSVKREFANKEWEENTARIVDRRKRYILQGFYIGTSILIPK